MPGEFEFIRWVRANTPADPRVLTGPGDDCAVLAAPAARVLVTTDMLTDGVDFVLSEAGAEAVGRKAMGVNLSDIAAMAGKPTAAVVSVALPTGPDRRLAEGLFRGLRAVADRYGVAVVGGDTNAWDGRLVVAVTVLGEATGTGPVLRSGARPGDWVFVTGPVGGSILGRHLAPEPRLAEARLLHDRFELRAMADVSDGLAADLNHILEESRCGAVVDATTVPVHPDAVELSRRTGQSPLEHALGDGEDFELVFVMSPAEGGRLLRQRPVPGLAKIGECVEAGLWLEQGGVRRPLPPTGWTHDVS